MFQKRLPYLTPMCEGWRIGQHYFSKYIWTHHAISDSLFRELLSPQATLTKPEVPSTPKKPCSWYHHKNIYIPTLKCLLCTTWPQGSWEIYLKTHCYTMKTSPAVSIWQMVSQQCSCNPGTWPRWFYRWWLTLSSWQNPGNPPINTFQFIQDHPTVI